MVAALAQLVAPGAPGKAMRDRQRRRKCAAVDIEHDVVRSAWLGCGTMRRQMAQEESAAGNRARDPHMGLGGIELRRRRGGREEIGIGHGRNLARGGSQE
jgi:hypothetical protein